MFKFNSMVNGENCSVRIIYLCRLPEHELQLAQCAPPDARVPRLELRLALIEEVDEVGRDGQEDGLRRRLEILLC